MLAAARDGRELAPGPDRPVLTLGRWLRARYGRTLRRVTLDLGLTCPVRDGALGFGGCIYCDPAGSGTGAARTRTLEQQWEEGLARARRLNPGGPAAIAYLQSYSNSYPELRPLRRALAYLSGFADAAPIASAGTRPDCFGDAAADLLASFRPPFAEVWVELGLETADDRVQDLVQRHDRLEHFRAACERARARGLAVVAHVIAGLPGEAPDGFLRTVEEAAAAGVSGIKFHQLMVLRRTKLEALWKRGEVALLRPEGYVAMVAEALELLPPHVVVHRLVAEAPPGESVAPSGWPPRAAVHAAIEQELRRRGAWQGCRAACAPR